MRKLKWRMQLAAMVVFAVIFGAIFMTAIDKGTRTEATDRQNIGIVPTAETSTAVTVPRMAIQTTVTLPQECEQTKEYTYYDVPMDDELQEYIQDVCEDYEFDRYDIVVALIQRESSFRENVISETGDYGYMQINECNHEWLSEELGLNDLLDGEQNIIAGVHILSDLYDKYEDIGLALMAYNCGEKGANDLWQQGIYSTAYSQGVIEIAEGLEQRNAEEITTLPS